MIKGIWAPNLWYCWEFSIIVREFCEPQSPNHRPFTSHGNDKPMPIWGCGIWVYHIFIHWESPNSRLIGFHQWGWVKTYWFSINLRVDEHPFASDFLGKQKGMTGEITSHFYGPFRKRSPTGVSSAGNTCEWNTSEQSTSLCGVSWLCWVGCFFKHQLNIVKSGKNWGSGRSIAAPFSKVDWCFGIFLGVTWMMDWFGGTLLWEKKNLTYYCWLHIRLYPMISH